MEIIEVLPTARPSLLLLNEYCLLEIFEFLDIDDLINLAKTSNGLRFVADRIFKIRSKFVRVDSEMLNIGEEYIDHLFHHIGRHVTSLEFYDHEGYRSLSKMVGNISNYCKNLKSLKCSNMRNTVYDAGFQPAYSFDNVELLTLDSCSDEFTEDFTRSFFESFHRLKAVYIINSSIEFNELKTILQNNRSIKSFSYDSKLPWNHRDFDCQLLELIPNVERLSLTTHVIYLDCKRIEELDSLLKLNRLTKLRVDSWFKYAKKFVRELATKGLIEELELYEVERDEDFIDTLASFSKLELLVLSGACNYSYNENRFRYVTIKYPISWPAQLKILRLQWFELTKNDLITMIQQLESIKSIDIDECTIAGDDIQNYDVAKLSQEI